MNNDWGGVIRITNYQTKSAASMPTISGWTGVVNSTKGKRHLRSCRHTHTDRRAAVACAREWITAWDA